LLFQPHTYTRTSYLFDEWRSCFAGVDKLYITHTYAAREEPDAGMSGEQLARAIEAPPAEYVASFEHAARVIAAELRPGDVFFTMGAGDVNDVGPAVVERLRARAAKGELR
jgi:UDP-N-acetylmuramate--alanine ligase